MRNILSGLILLLGIAFITAGCTEAESAAKDSGRTPTPRQEEQAISAQADEAQLQGAMQAAAKYVKSQYTIDGMYTTKDYDAQLAILQKKLRPLLSSDYYTWATDQEALALPLHVAIREKDSITPKDITIRSRSISGGEQQIHLSYRFNFHLNKRGESVPLGGKLIMQNDNGVWLVVSDHNNAKRLLEWHNDTMEP